MEEGLNDPVAALNRAFQDAARKAIAEAKREERKEARQEHRHPRIAMRGGRAQSRGPSLAITVDDPEPVNQGTILSGCYITLSGELKTVGVYTDGNLADPPAP